ncbi:MAG TPA: polysaccharide deacetylase family protein [Candidatus Sulfotelmatobacter sp.]|nr:polysaccharide deacetylase family protein [Candidatus Sulfotelmatobacter sp.]
MPLADLNQSLTRLDRLATVCLGHPCARIFAPAKPACVPILMYHSISDNLFAKAHPYYQINTLPEIFAQQMRWLRNSGYRATGLSEALAGLQMDEDLSKKVVLTFDDGYRDFYTDALPVLKQCGFTATIFLATDRIQNSPARIEGVDYLTWNDVRELHREGICFGAHTVTHPDLRSLPPDQIEYELGCSKELIEDRLGAAVESFSYPHGFPEEDQDYATYLEDILCNLGYEHGVTTILGRANRKTNRFFLPRLPVNSLDDPSFFRAKLEGGYDWLHWPQLLKKYLFHHAAIFQQTPKNNTVSLSR